MQTSSPPSIGATAALELSIPRSRALLALAAILVLAAALRLPGLWSYPLEQDELYTVIESTALFDSPLRPGIEARPLYYLLQHALFWFLPDSPAALRLLPFIFGMLGIWAVWLLGRRMISPTAGTAAALLTAVSPWHMYVSGMARYGSLVFLLSALLCLFLLRACAEERPRAYLAALAVLILGTLTHPAFLFPAVGMATGTLLVRDSGRLGLRLPSRLALLRLWLPYLGAMALGMTVLMAVDREEALRNHAGRSLGEVLRLLPAVVQWMGPAIFAAGGLGALAAFCFGAGASLRRWGALTLGGILSTMVLLQAAALVTNTYADYAIGMLPLILVGGGALVQQMTGQPGRAWQAAAATAVLLAAVLPQTVSHLADGTRFDFRPAFQTITRTAPQTPVLVRPVVLQQHYAPQLRGIDFSYERARLDAHLAEHGDLWVVAPVQRYGLVYDGDGSGARWLAENCRLAASHVRPRLDYRTYQVNLYRCQTSRAVPAGPDGAAEEVAMGDPARPRPEPRQP